MTKGKSRKSRNVGNQHNRKLKTPEQICEAYRQYCEFISEGWPRECFITVGLEKNITWEAMEKYIKANPDHCPEEEMKKAMALRYKHWLNEGITLMKGGYKFGSPQVWSVMMRNMFKNYRWDKEDLQSDNAPTEASILTLTKMKEINVGNYNESKTSPKLSGRDFED